MIFTVVVFNGVQAALQPYLKSEGDDNRSSLSERTPKKPRLDEGSITADVPSFRFLDNLPETALVQILEELDSFSLQDIKALRHVSRALNHQVVDILNSSAIFSSHFRNEEFNSERELTGRKLGVYESCPQSTVQCFIDNYKQYSSEESHTAPTFEGFIAFMHRNKNMYKKLYEEESSPMKTVFGSIEKCKLNFSFFSNQVSSFSDYESYLKKHPTNCPKDFVPLDKFYRFGHFLNLSSPFARFVQNNTVLHIWWRDLHFFLPQDFIHLKGVSTRIEDLQSDLHIHPEALDKITKLTITLFPNFYRWDKKTNFSCNGCHLPILADHYNHQIHDNIKEFSDDGKLKLPVLRHLIINE